MVTITLSRKRETRQESPKTKQNKAKLLNFIFNWSRWRIVSWILKTSSSWTKTKWNKIGNLMGKAVKNKSPICLVYCVLLTTSWELPLWEKVQVPFKSLWLHFFISQSNEKLRVQEKRLWKLYSPCFLSLKVSTVKSFLLFPREDMKTCHCKCPSVSSGPQGRFRPLTFEVHVLS